MTNCQCLTTNGQPCQRSVSLKSTYNPKFCWQHQNCNNLITSEILSVQISKPKSPVIIPNKVPVIIPNKVPVEIPKHPIPSTQIQVVKKPSKSPLSHEIPLCRLTSFKISRTDSNKLTDVLYGEQQVLDLLNQCQVPDSQKLKCQQDYNSLRTFMRPKLIAQIKQILDLYWSGLGQYVKNSHNISQLQSYLVTPQLQVDQINSYNQKVIDSQTQMLVIKKNGKSLDKIKLILLKLIDESQKQTEINGLLHYIRLILAQSVGMLTIKTPNLETTMVGFTELNNKLDPNGNIKIVLRNIDTYLTIYFNVTSGCLSKLYKLYPDQFPLKTDFFTYNKTVIRIKQGVHVFKGVQKPKSQRLTAMDNYFWVAVDPHVSMGYIIPEAHVEYLKELCQSMGYIGMYKVKQDIILLNLSHIGNLQKVKSKITDPQLKKAIETGFIIAKNADGSESVTRNSYTDMDLIFAKWLCQHGYDGYACPILKHSDPTKGTFHSEIMLCQPQKYLKYITSYDINDIGFHYCQMPYLQMNTRLTHI